MARASDPKHKLFYAEISQGLHPTTASPPNHSLGSRSHLFVCRDKQTQTPPRLRNSNPHTHPNPPCLKVYVRLRWKNKGGGVRRNHGGGPKFVPISLNSRSWPICTRDVTPYASSRIGGMEWNGSPSSCSLPPSKKKSSDVGGGDREKY